MLAQNPANSPSHQRQSAGSTPVYTRQMREIATELGIKDRGSTQSRDRKQQKQSAILRDATREFSLMRRPETAEIERYKELFYQLVDRLEKNDRRMISAMLARSNFAPRPVALYFAHDALEVAAPFLLFSPVLNDLDLRAIAARKGRLYADVIRKRKLPMEPYTTDRLAEENFEETTISLQSASPSIQTENADTAETPKFTLRDEVLDLASKGGRTGKRGLDQTLDQKPSDVLQTKEGQPQSTVHTTKEDFRLPKSAVRELLNLARAGKIDAIARAIEPHCGLAAADTQKILTGSKSDEPIYLIKAMGISSPHDIQLAMMIQPAIGRSMESYRAAKKTLAELDQGICRIIFNEIGARFELPQDRQFAVPKAETAPAVKTPASQLNNAMQQRREAVQTRYQGDDRFAGGLSDRWPGSDMEKQSAGLSMAG